MAFLIRALPGTLGEGDGLDFFAVGGALDGAAGGTGQVGHVLEFHAGDDVGDAIIAVGLDLGRVVWIFSSNRYRDATRRTTGHPIA